MPFRRVAFAAAITALTLPSAALAAHGTVGLWSSTTTMTAQGMPPQTQTATYCMTAAEVASDAPGNTPGCTYSNIGVSGRTYTADMVCKGQVNATGHIVTTYDSDTHYRATITMTMQGMSFVNKVDGRWVKADCAGAQR